MVHYEFFGDSNIARNWKAVASDSDRLKGAVLRSVTTLVLLKDCLKTVSQSTSILVISALSNPVSRITYDGNELTLRTELDSLFDEVMDLLHQTLNCNPNLQVCSFVMQPPCFGCICTLWPFSCLVCSIEQRFLRIVLAFVE
jgi:hypothetical protein